MANGQIITTNGKKIVLNRAFKSSPDYTIPSILKVGTGTGTPSIADSDLGTAVSIDGDNFKSILSGYPLLDEPNLQVTLRAILLVTEANSNSLTEVGFVNNDGTKKLYSRAVHTAITKNNTTEISYVLKTKII